MLTDQQGVPHLDHAVVRGLEVLEGQAQARCCCRAQTSISCQFIQPAAQQHVDKTWRMESLHCRSCTLYNSSPTNRQAYDAPEQCEARYELNKDHPPVEVLYCAGAESFSNQVASQCMIAHAGWSGLLPLVNI
jgi:hypothetical protein